MLAAGSPLPKPMAGTATNSTAADALVVETITALGLGPRHVVEQVATDIQRQLQRVLFARANHTLADALHRWRTMYTACRLEDALFVRQRELRRAHASITALQQRV
jgi:hypothetical protein